MTLQVGDRAPDFSMPTVSGGTVTLGGLRGKKVVLYFYPKDDTPGCTVEACSFRDNMPNFQGINAEVIGVSRDNTDSHRAFRDKYALNFTLASDDTGQVTENYGVWREKSMYGKTFMGIQRSTFLIDENGIIAKIWPTVQVDGHSQEVLAALKGQAAPVKPAAKPAAVPAVSPSPIETKILASFQAAATAKPKPAAKAKPKSKPAAKKKVAAKKKPAKKAAAKTTKKAAAKKKPVKKAAKKAVKKTVKKAVKKAAKKPAKKVAKKPTKKAAARKPAKKTTKKPAKRVAARSSTARRTAARRPARRAKAVRRR